MAKLSEGILDPLSTLVKENLIETTVKKSLDEMGIPQPDCPLGEMSEYKFAALLSYSPRIRTLIPAASMEAFGSVVQMLKERLAKEYGISSGNKKLTDAIKENVEF